MTLAEVRAEIEVADHARLQVLARALVEHVVDMHQSFKVIGLESKIGLKDEVQVKDAPVWPGDW